VPILQLGPYSINGGPDLYYQASLDYDAGVSREYTTSQLRTPSRQILYYFSIGKYQRQ
jgi:hypothetical protein